MGWVVVGVFGFGGLTWVMMTAVVWLLTHASDFPVSFRHWPLSLLPACLFAGAAWGLVMGLVMGLRGRALPGGSG